MYLICPYYKPLFKAWVPSSQAWGPSANFIIYLTPVHTHISISIPLKENKTAETEVRLLQRVAFKLNFALKMLMFKSPLA